MIAKSVEQKIKRQHILYGALLVILVLLAYAQGLSYPFNFDSLSLITEKKLTIFAREFEWLHLLTVPRVIVTATFWFNFYFFGMSEFWFRAVNVCLHAFNAVLLYVFLYQSFKTILADSKSELSKYQSWALIGALLFALNPVGVYVVVYVVQRFTILATTFSLLALLAYLKGLKKLSAPSLMSSYFCLAVFFYYLALHSKEHAVMVPAVCFLLTLLVRPFGLHLFKVLLLPYLGFSLIAAQMLFLSKAIVLQVYEPHAKLLVEHVARHSVNNPAMAEAVSSHHMYLLSILNQCWLYFRYLYTWLVPDGMRMAIDMPLHFSFSVLSFTNILGLTLLLVYTGLAIHCLCQKKAQGLFGLALLFPLCLFATEFSTVRYNESFVLYRSYLWMGGLFLALPFLSQWTVLKKLKPIFKWLLLGTYLTLQMVVLQDRQYVFRSDLDLWRDVVAKVDLHDPSLPAAFRAAGNLGSALGQAGEFEEAIRYYKIATKLNPDYQLPWHTLGAVIAMKGQPTQAIQFLKQAIAINPTNAEPYYNLGSIYSRLNKPFEAVVMLEKSTLLDPRFPEAYYNLGNVRYKLKRFKEALEAYHAVLALNPKHIEARHNLAVTLAEVGNYQEAIGHYQEVIRLNPAHANASYNLGRSFLALKKYDEAQKSFNTSLQLNSQNPFISYYLALTLSEMGQFQKAATLLTGLLKIKTDFAPGHELLAQIKKKMQLKGLP